MNKLFKNILQFLLSLGLGSTILYFVYQSQSKTYVAECMAKGNAVGNCNLMDKLITDFQQTNFGWIALVMLAFLASNYSRTAKWMILLKPLGYRPKFINGYLSILVAYFANIFIPRIGEVIRAGVFSKYEKIPVEKVMGTIVVDRVIDVICLLLAFGLALVFEFDKLWGYISQSSGEAGTGGSGNGKLLILGGIAALVLLVFLLRKKLAKTVFFQKIMKMVAGFWEGILTVGKLDRPWLFVFHSLNIWLLYFIMTWLGFKAFGPTSHLDLRAALTVFAFGTLGMVIPSPGGMGTFHGLVIWVLTSFYAIRGDDAFSVANIIFFLIQIGLNAVMGLLALLVLPILNKDYKPLVEST
jgi:glycosyltransferase 2 family protein